MTRGKCALIIALLAAQAAWGDVTIQYQFEFKLGPVIPPQAAEAVRAQMGTAVPAGIQMRVKGQRCMTSVGPVTTIADGNTKEVTLMNSISRLFATVPSAGYTENVLTQAQLPLNALQALQNMKIEASASKTGQTKVIQGIQTEDNLLAISIEAPSPAGPAVTVRLEMHTWLASDRDQFPAVKELDGCSAAAGNSDPRAVLDQVLALVPELKEKFGDQLAAFVDAKKGPALGMNVDVFVPAIAMMLPAQPGAPPVDPAAPLIQVEMNLVQLSQDPIPDAAFRVPDGYQAAPLQDLLKSAATPSKLAQTPPAIPPAAAALPDYTGPIVRPGNGVAFSNPIPVSRPEPRYSEPARRNKIEGAVLVSLVIDPEGNTRNIKVIRSLEPGLDQKAIEAVSQWKFKPALLKDGGPVAIQAQIQVNFRLLDNPSTR